VLNPTKFELVFELLPLSSIRGSDPTSVKIKKEYIVELNMKMYTKIFFATNPLVLKNNSYLSLHIFPIYYFLIDKGYLRPILSQDWHCYCTKENLIQEEDAAMTPSPMEWNYS